VRWVSNLCERPNEKRGLLSLATGLESLAKLGENEALLLDVRAELSEVRNEVTVLRNDLPGIIANAITAILERRDGAQGLTLVIPHRAVPVVITRMKAANA